MCIIIIIIIIIIISSSSSSSSSNYVIDRYVTLCILFYIAIQYCSLNTIGMPHLKILID